MSSTEKVPPARAKSARRGNSQARTRDPVRTRAKILAAATEEFAGRGLEGSRVDAIAQRAGVNKRMLYHYFGGKDDLFIAVMETAYEDIRQREAELDLSGKGPREAIAEIVRFTFRYFLENQHFISLLGSENLKRARHVKRSKRARQINQPIIAILAELIDSGVAQGVIRRGVDPLQLYLSISGVSYLYFCNIHTLSAIFDKDLSGKAELAAREAHVVEVILGYLRP